MIYGIIVDNNSVSKPYISDVFFLFIVFASCHISCLDAGNSTNEPCSFRSPILFKKLLISSIL